jgi:hypothetical protein
MRVGHTYQPLKAQLRAASGRSSKVIKDRQHVEAAVEVPGAGRLVLSVDSQGRYALHVSLAGGEAPTATRPPLAVGELHTGVVRSSA